MLVALTHLESIKFIYLKAHISVEPYLVHYKAWLVGARQKLLEVGTNTSIQTGRHMLYPLSHHFIKPIKKSKKNKTFQHRGKIIQLQFCHTTICPGFP